MQISAQKQDAYFVLSLAYYDQKQYETCMAYLSQNVYSNGALTEDAEFGRFYYITGSCLFEQEQYAQAVSYYEKAVRLQPDEIAYYRDYVIALARTGDLKKAEEVLQTAKRKGVTADILSLLNGEIASLQNNYEQAKAYLLECADATEDDYIRLRAFTKLDDVYGQMYQNEQQYTERITLLEDALKVLPGEYQVTLMERLAQVYIDYSDVAELEQNCEKAVEVFKEMEVRGYGTFTSQYNVAILYEKMGKYNNAKEQLEIMSKRYNENYNIYKRLAFVELSIQARKENVERDYSVFNGYFETAKELYQENVAKEDVEMLSLQQLYEDVVSNGWLEVK